jgi:hypothetical protein
VVLFSRQSKGNNYKKVFFAKHFFEIFLAKNFVHQITPISGKILKTKMKKSLFGHEKNKVICSIFKILGDRLQQD